MRQKVNSVEKVQTIAFYDLKIGKIKTKNDQKCSYQH